MIRALGYSLVAAWECEKPPKKRCYLRKEFRMYPHYIVFDFEALLQVMNQLQTDDLAYVSRHVPVSVAIHDSLGGSTTFIEHEDPKMLVHAFGECSKAWSEWVNQVAVIGFNSGNYDINMIKQYFVERIGEDINERSKWLRRTTTTCS